MTSDTHVVTGPGSGPAPEAPRAVRPARAEDAAAIGALQAAAWRSDLAGLVPEEVLAQALEKDFGTLWELALRNPLSPRHRFLVAVTGPRVAGIAAVGPSPDRDATDADGELTVLEVDPAQRGQGHGSRLLAAATDLLREEGSDRLRVWVTAQGVRRREFLAAAGLAPDGVRRRYRLPGGAELVEVRLTAVLGPEDPADPTR